MRDPEPWCEEQALWAAVIHQALSDATSKPPAGKRVKNFGALTNDERRHARQWLTEPGDANECGTLAWVCDALGLDVRAVVDRCRELAERGWKRKDIHVTVEGVKSHKARTRVEACDG